MTEVTSDLMYELMKRMHHEISELRQDVSEVKKELNVIRGHMIGIQTDIHNIYGILARHDERLDRIERRLELRELAEAQKPFDHNK
jgi:predicted  nucleic acid-binding Zn-ribbon protein